MNCIEKKRQLESIINERLLPLIDSDYVLYGLPYYKNVGDVLIWDGELEFLKKVPHKCVGTCSWSEYPDEKLPENVIILITGGGYFGDMWRYAFSEALKGISANKNNKIIFLPNTVYYIDNDTMDKDIEFLSQFPNVIVCARDQESYAVIKNNFRNEVLLVPDMAFCMNERYIRKWSRKKPSRPVLFFKRNDKEFPNTDIKIDFSQYEEHDWLPMEKSSWNLLNFYRLESRTGLISKINRRLGKRLSTWLYKKMFRRIITEEGVRQLSDYETIVTTRLHAMILGCMLGREIIMIDNSYGKLSSYYKTWLFDCDTIKVY